MPLALSSLPRPSRLLAAVVGVLAVAAVLAAVAAGAHLHTEARQNAERNISLLALGLGEQTARSLHALDLVLIDVVQDLAALDDAANFRVVVASRETQRSVRARLVGLPQADAIVAIAADGTVLMTSRGWPTPAVSVADRAYFQAVQDGTWRTPFLSEPVSSRDNGARVFQIVRRVTSHSGKLLGVVLGSIDLANIAGYYAAIGLPPGTGVALVREDGVVLTRIPSDLVRSPGPAYPGLHVDAAGLAYGRPLAGFPAGIEVSISHAAIYADWRRQAVVLGGGAACALGCMLLLLRALLWQFRRLEAARLAMQENSLLLETTLANMDEGLMMITAEHEVAVCNDRAGVLLGLPKGLLHSRPDLHAVLPWQARESLPDNPASTADGDPPQQPRNTELRRPDGTCLEVRSVPLAGGGMVCTFTDVTQRRLADDRVSYAAYHDALTGLNNRALFAEALENAVLAAGEAGGPAVLFLDLDRFKLVNDTLGHHAGDELLQQVAARMSAAVRASDTLARMGGDEFAVVMPAVPGIEEALGLAHRLLQVIRQPFRLPEGPMRIGVSIGIAGFGLHGGSARELLSNADLALYRAKATGCDTVCVFDAQLDTRMRGELLLEDALQYALQEGQFTLVYQPILDIRSQGVVGAEALVRWQHPTKGTIAPGNFIALAERSGLIVPLGSWVMQTACREALTWASPVSVSVNVAPSQLRRRAMVNEVRDLLAATGLEPSRLKLEVTEGQLLEESDDVIEVMAGLRALGVGLALDDFGTGHSSLSMLRAFPFSALKIDRRFTEGILHDARSRGLLEAILQICRVMELDCVAEGVETEEQLALVRSLGCTHAQGYLIGRPEPPEAIRRTLWHAAAVGRHALPAMPDSAAVVG